MQNKEEKHSLFKSFDWRRVNAAEMSSEPIDDYCRRLRDFLNGKEDEEVQLVRKINKNSFYKEQLEALLLGGMTEGECSKKFNVTPFIIKLYKKLYFDIDLKNSEVELSSAIYLAKGLTEQRWKSVAIRFGTTALQLWLGHKTEITQEATDKLLNRLQFALLARCAEIETINPNSEKATKFVLNSINTFIKLESAKKDTTSEEVQGALQRVVDLLQKDAVIPKRTKEDLGL